MVPIIYIVLVALAVFAIGLAGMVASRHFLIMMLAVEAAISASTILAAAFFYYTAAGDVLALLFSIWAVLSVEVMGLVAFYRYLLRYEVSLDVTKLSKLRE